MKHRTFQRKLLGCFALFALVIFGLLWLLQTVFMQMFYDRMVISNTIKRADQIETLLTDGAENTVLDTIAEEASLLIVLADETGNPLYSADEHSAVYHGKQSGQATDGASENPYQHGTEGSMNWQMGRQQNLPDGFSSLLSMLPKDGESVSVGTEDGKNYLYARRLPDGSVLFLSAALVSAGTAAGIIRLQLLLAMAVSLILGALLAWLLAKRFSRPVAELSEQTKTLSGGQYTQKYQPGFCAELDELNTVMNETADSLSRPENARRALLANVSHDLRTPLTMIKGYAEMVREISWSDPKQREQDLDIIIRESDRLTGLVNDILEYSALQEQAPGSFAPFDLCAVTRSVIAQFSPLCAEKGCQIRADLPDEAVVNGDEKQIERVLYNLIDNAVRHAGDPGIITVQIRRDQRAVRTEIRDNGAGIPKEELLEIWDRYFTARQRRDGSTSGLGLSIVKEILLAHDAGFGAESEEDSGSVFWFSLP